MTNTFQITHKLFHNSPIAINCGLAIQKGKKVSIYLTPEINDLPAPVVKVMPQNIKEMIEKFLQDTPHDQYKYPIRYDEDFCLEITRKH